jgi:hypothetical protein
MLIFPFDPFYDTRYNIVDFNLIDSRCYFWGIYIKVHSLIFSGEIILGDSWLII